MTKRMGEMEDDLDERVDDIKSELKENVVSYFKDNPDDDWDNYYQSQGADAIHEIVDSSTPIYYYNIDCLYYLYGDDADDAYKNAGIGDGKENNYRQLAIYCLLEEKAWDYFRELEDQFDEWEADDSEDKSTFAKFID